MDAVSGLVNPAAGLVQPPPRFGRYATRVLLPVLLLATACSPGKPVATPELLVPVSVHTLAVVSPEALGRSPMSASMVGWTGMHQQIRDLGFDSTAFDRLAVAELESFDKGRGGLFVGAGLSGDPLVGVDAHDDAAFTIHGLQFRPALREGWYWTRYRNRWLASCDRTGCEMAAPVLAGKEPSLFESPPSGSLERVIGALSRTEPYTLVWIPRSSSSDAFGAATVWAGVGASLYLRSSVPYSLLEKVGGCSGLAAEGHDEAGKARVLMRVGMSSTDSAGLVAGSLSLLHGAASGMEAFAKVLGAEIPEDPNRPEIDIGREDDVILLRWLTVPPEYR